MAKKITGVVKLLLLLAILMPIMIRKTDIVEEPSEPEGIFWIAAVVGWYFVTGMATMYAICEGGDC